MRKFKVGDRVIGCNFSKIDGCRGTILKVEAAMFAVAFDKHIKGHNFSTTKLNKQCKPGHGFWVMPRHLKRCDPDSLDEILGVYG